MTRRDREAIPRPNLLADELILLGEALQEGFGFDTPLESILRALADLSLLGRDVALQGLISNKSQTNPEVIFPHTPGDPLSYPVDTLGNPKSISIRGQRTDAKYNTDILAGMFEKIALTCIQIIQNPEAEPFMGSTKERIRKGHKLTSKEFWYRRRASRKIHGKDTIVG